MERLGWGVTEGYITYAEHLHQLIKEAQAALDPRAQQLAWAEVLGCQDARRLGPEERRGFGHETDVQIRNRYEGGLNIGRTKLMLEQACLYGNGDDK